MDPTQIKKIQAMKRYKRCQFVNNLYLYLLSALSCSVFCCVTLCFPYVSSLFMVHISSLIPRLLSSKLLFILLGNLIIFFLVVNSRILSSDSSSSTCVVYYDEYIKSSQTMTTLKPQIPSTPPDRLRKNIKTITILEKRVEKATASKDGGGDEKNLIPSCSDELNKRAEDFIARVNRQRKLELSLLHYDI